MAGHRGPYQVLWIKPWWATVCITSTLTLRHLSGYRVWGLGPGIVTQQRGAVNSIPGSVFHPECDSSLSAARSLIPKPHGLCPGRSDPRMQILQAQCKILTSLFPKAGGEEESRAFLVSTTPSWPSRLSGHWLSARAAPNSNSQESHLGSQLPPPAAQRPQRDSCHSVGNTSPPPAHTTH